MDEIPLLAGRLDGDAAALALLGGAAAVTLLAVLFALRPSGRAR